MKIENVAIVEMPYYEGYLTKVTTDHEFIQDKDKDWFHEQFFINKNGEIVAKFVQYSSKNYGGRAEQLSPFRQDLFILAYDKPNIEETEEENIEIVQVIDSEYKVLGTYDYIEYGEEEKTFKVKKNKLYGFIDINGVEIIKPQYYKAESFYNGFAFAAEDYNKWGLINKENEVIIPFEFERPSEMRISKSGHCVFKKKTDEKTISYIFNTNGEVVFEHNGRIKNLDYGNFLVEKEKNTFEIMRLNNG